MILFCGIPSEPPLRLAIDAARKVGLESLVLNQRESPFADLALDVRNGVASGVLRLRERDWPLEQVVGVYARLMDPYRLPENQPQGRRPPDATRLERSLLVHQALSEWLELAECRVVNRPGATASNLSKPYQAQIIRAGGFRIPPTLITTDPTEARAFAREHRRVVFKSISSVRSIVRELLPGQRADLERIRGLPTQFQAYVPGRDVRVHVVGTKVFATEIDSLALDYRYAARDGLETRMQRRELPARPRRRCVELAARLGLPFCGIDLRLTPDGDCFCFEVNPSPAYSYYQEQTGQPIARALARYLGGRSD